MKHRGFVTAATLACVGGAALAVNIARQQAGAQSLPSGATLIAGAERKMAAVPAYHINSRVHYEWFAGGRLAGEILHYSVTNISFRSGAYDQLVRSNRRRNVNGHPGKWKTAVEEHAVVGNLNTYRMRRGNRWVCGSGELSGGILRPLAFSGPFRLTHATTLGATTWASVAVWHVRLVGVTDIPPDGLARPRIPKPRTVIDELIAQKTGLIVHEQQRQPPQGQPSPDFLLTTTTFSRFGEPVHIVLKKLCPRGGT